MSHTPGPWKVIERETLEDGSVYPRHIVGGQLGHEVCKLESVFAAMEAAGNPESFWNTSATCQANAALIAAAPELKSCTEELAAIVREMCAAFGIPTPDATLERADAALSKARGRA